LKNKANRAFRALFGNAVGISSEPNAVVRSAIPSGAWPLEMRAQMAAAYCDEPSVDAFLAKVRLGVYSAEIWEKGCLPKWHRLELDRDIAHRHGLSFDDGVLIEDATDLV
jgi:hypothetical protein